MEALTLAGGSFLLGLGSALCIYNTQKLSKDPNYNNSSLLQQAHNYLLWTAILCWIIIVLLILLIVLLVIGKLRFGIAIKIGLAIVIAGMLVAGGLSVAAGATIKDLQHPDAAINGIYFQVILCTILFLGGAFLVSAVLIILEGRPEAKVKEEEIKVEQLKQEEVKLAQNITMEQEIAPTSPVGEIPKAPPPPSSISPSGKLVFSSPGGYRVQYG